MSASVATMHNREILFQQYQPNRKAISTCSSSHMQGCHIQSSIFAPIAKTIQLSRSHSEPGYHDNIQLSAVVRNQFISQKPQLQRKDSNKSDGCQQSEASGRYKTELCRPFEETGQCRYGTKCQFAHGSHELRNLNRHPKYKTELCRTFHTTGFCSYGQRCNFIHNDEERRGPAPERVMSRSNRPHALTLTGNVSGSVGQSPASSISGDSPSQSPTPFHKEDRFFSLSLSSPTPSYGSDSGSSVFPSPPAIRRCDIFDSALSPLDLGLSLPLFTRLSIS